MTEFYDLATDTDSGLNWSTLPNGTEVHVQDRIVGLYTDFSDRVEIDFLYTGTKIPWLTYAFAFSTDNFCEYGVNDIVRLDGTVEVETWGSFAELHAVPLWHLEGGSPPIPAVTLGPRQVLSSEVRFPVTSVSEACKGLHFRAQLWQYNGSVDGIFLRWDGIRGIYLRYDDADGSGTVTPGDLIRVVDPPSGPLELHLYFKGNLLASSAWTSP